MMNALRWGRVIVYHWPKKQLKQVLLYKTCLGGNKYTPLQSLQCHDTPKKRSHKLRPRSMAND